MNTPVNFEIAKLLKDKGFRKNTEANWWILAKDHSDNYKKDLPVDETKIFFAANHRELSLKTQIDDDREHNVYHVLSVPTIAEVVKWLYDKHGIFVTVNIPYEEFGKFSAEIWGKNLDDGIKILLADGMSMFDSIEKAYEEGIEHCLTNLIKENEK